MMIGNILINVLLGLVGFVITFLFTVGNNLLATSMVRGLIGFMVWFMLAFLLRWVLGVITKPSEPSEGLENSIEDDGKEALGAQLDISTPNEDEELINLLKPKPGQGNHEDSKEFKPLQPPQLVTINDPEELAKAVRHLKEE